MFKKYLVVIATFLLVISSPFSHAAAVNINTANAATLADALNGIGVTKANAIVAYRDKHGNFGTVDDLVNVKGIGMKLIARNRELISVGDTAAARVKSSDVTVTDTNSAAPGATLPAKGSLEPAVQPAN